MDNTELIDFARGYGVTDAGIELLKDVCASEPARRVRSSTHGKNRSVRYPSKKMGLVIQAESFSLEFSSVLIKEFNVDVYRYYDQPQSIDLIYRSGKRNVRQPSTLDFFVISKTFIGFEEWKPFKELEKLSLKSPERFFYDESKCCFVSPAIEKALGGTGLHYKICTERDINSVFINNLNFLNGYFQSLEKYLESNDPFSQIENLKKVIKKSGGLPLNKALGSVSENDVIYYAICSGEIYFPIAELDLTSYSSAKVFLDEKSWQAYRFVTHDDRCEDDQSNIQSQIPPALLYTSEENLIDVSKRLNSLSDYEKGKSSFRAIASQFGISIRTVRRWYKSIAGLETREEKLVALLPNNANKGNRLSKIPQTVIAKIDEIVEQQYLSKKAISRHQVALRVINWCKENSVCPPSKPTIYQRIDMIPHSKVNLFRKGSKAAYQSEVNFFDLSSELNFRGAYFLQYCHIDHTQLDIEAVNEFDQGEGKPWLTYIVDDFSGLILAFYMSYRSPSYVSVMMAVRSMVRSYGRKPEYVLVDGGKEFQSVDFEKFCAAYNIGIMSREGQPRSGGGVEREFGKVNTGLIHNLDGNTKFMKDVRSLSRTHKPKSSAYWTLSEISVHIGVFVKASNECSSVKGKLSPSGLVDASIKKYGNRDYLNQDYSMQFYYLSLPSVPRKQVTLRRGKSVVYDYLEYWNNSFSHAPLKGIKVDMKWDPEDINFAYVFYEGKWLQCRLSNRKRRIKNDNKQLASEAMHQEVKINNIAKQKSYEKIASITESVEKEMINVKEENRLLNNGSLAEDMGEDGVNNVSEDKEFCLFDLEIPNIIEK